MGKASAKAQVQEEPVTEAETPLKTKKTAVRKDASASINIWWKCSKLLFFNQINDFIRLKGSEVNRIWMKIDPEAHPKSRRHFLLKDLPNRLQLRGDKFIQRRIKFIRREGFGRAHPYVNRFARPQWLRAVLNVCRRVAVEVGLVAP